MIKKTIHLFLKFLYLKTFQLLNKLSLFKVETNILLLLTFLKTFLDKWTLTKWMFTKCEYREGEGGNEIENPPRKVLDLESKKKSSCFINNSVPSNNGGGDAFDINKHGKTSLSTKEFEANANNLGKSTNVDVSAGETNTTILCETDNSDILHNKSVIFNTNIIYDTDVRRIQIGAVKPNENDNNSVDRDNCDMYNLKTNVNDAEQLKPNISGIKDSHNTDKSTTGGASKPVGEFTKNNNACIKPGGCPMGDCATEDCPTRDCPTNSCSTGDCPTGNCSTGDYPTGDCPTGDCPTKDCPTRDCPTNSCSTGDCPTGDCSTGDYPTGDYPTGDCPIKDCPTRDCPTGDCPIKDCPTGDCPTGNCSTGDCPTGNCSTKDCPTRDCSTGDCPTKNCPTGDCPTGNCSTGDCPTSNCSTKDCPTRDCSTGDCPTKNCPTGDCPTGNCSTGDCPTSNCSTKDCPTGDCSTGDCPTKDCPTGDCPTGDCPTGNCPTGDCPTGNCPTGNCPTGTCPTGNCPIEDCPTGTCPTEVCPTGTCPTEVCPTEVCPTGTCPTEVCPTGKCPTEVCPTGKCPIGPDGLEVPCEFGAWFGQTRLQNWLAQKICDFDYDMETFAVILEITFMHPYRDFLRSESVTQKSFSILLKEFSLIPEFYLAVTALITTTYCSLILYNKFYKKRNLIQFSAMYISILIIIFTFMLANKNELLTTKHFSMNFSFLNDALGNFAKVVTTTLSLICAYLTKNYLEKDKVNYIEYDLLVLYAVLGLLLMTTANDFTTIFLTLELQAFSLYILAGIKRSSMHSIDSGLKYIFLASFSTGYYLLGSSLLFGLSGLLILSNFHFFSNDFYQIENENESVSIDLAPINLEELIEMPFIFKKMLTNNGKNLEKKAEMLSFCCYNNNYNNVNKENFLFDRQMCIYTGPKNTHLLPFSLKDISPEDLIAYVLKSLEEPEKSNFHSILFEEYVKEIDRQEQIQLGSSLYSNHRSNSKECEELGLGVAFKERLKNIIKKIKKEVHSEILIRVFFRTCRTTLKEEFGAFPCRCRNKNEDILNELLNVEAGMVLFIIKICCEDEKVSKCPLCQEIEKNLRSNYDYDTHTWTLLKNTNKTSLDNEIIDYFNKNKTKLKAENCNDVDCDFCNELLASFKVIDGSGKLEIQLEKVKVRGEKRKKCWFCQTFSEEYLKEMEKESASINLEELIEMPFIFKKMLTNNGKNLEKKAEMLSFCCYNNNYNNVNKENFLFDRQMCIYTGPKNIHLLPFSLKDISPEDLIAYVLKSLEEPEKSNFHSILFEEYVKEIDRQEQIQLGSSMYSNHRSNSKECEELGLGVAFKERLKNIIKKIKKEVHSEILIRVFFRTCRTTLKEEFGAFPCRCRNKNEDILNELLNVEAGMVLFIIKICCEDEKVSKCPLCQEIEKNLRSDYDYDTHTWTLLKNTNKTSLDNEIIDYFNKNKTKLKAENCNDVDCDFCNELLASFKVIDGSGKLEIQLEKVKVRGEKRKKCWFCQTFSEEYLKEMEKESASINLEELIEEMPFIFKKMLTNNGKNLEKKAEMLSFCCYNNNYNNVNKENFLFDRQMCIYTGPKNTHLLPFSLKDISPEDLIAYVLKSLEEPEKSNFHSILFEEYVKEIDRQEQIQLGSSMYSNHRSNSKECEELGLGVAFKERLKNIIKKIKKEVHSEILIRVFFRTCRTTLKEEFGAFPCRCRNKNEDILNELLNVEAGMVLFIIKICCEDEKVSKCPLCQEIEKNLRSDYDYDTHTWTLLKNTNKTSLDNEIIDYFNKNKTKLKAENCNDVDCDFCNELLASFKVIDGSGKLEIQLEKVKVRGEKRKKCWFCQTFSEEYLKEMEKESASINLEELIEEMPFIFKKMLTNNGKNLEKKAEMLSFCCYNNNYNNVNKENFLFDRQMCIYTGPKNTHLLPFSLKDISPEDLIAYVLKSLEEPEKSNFHSILFEEYVKEIDRQEQIQLGSPMYSNHRSNSKECEELGLGVAFKERLKNIIKKIKKEVHSEILIRVFFRTCRTTLKEEFGAFPCRCRNKNEDILNELLNVEAGMVLFIIKICCEDEKVSKCPLCQEIEKNLRSNYDYDTNTWTLLKNTNKTSLDNEIIDYFNKNKTKLKAENCNDVDCDFCNELLASFKVIDGSGKLEIQLEKVKVRGEKRKKCWFCQTFSEEYLKEMEKERQKQELIFLKRMHIYKKKLKDDVYAKYYEYLKEYFIQRSRTITEETHKKIISRAFFKTCALADFYKNEFVVYTCEHIEKRFKDAWEIDYIKNTLLPNKIEKSCRDLNNKEKNKSPFCQELEKNLKNSCKIVSPTKTMDPELADFLEKQFGPDFADILEKRFGPDYVDKLEQDITEPELVSDTSNLPFELVFETISKEEFEIILTYEKNFFRMLSFSLNLILISFFFKLAGAPFHLWALDIYEGSPTSSTIFFAIVTKFSIFTVLAKICYYGFYNLLQKVLYQYIIFVSVSSAFVGAIAGLKEQKLKSLLVYSSINNIGYLLLGLAIGTLNSIKAAFFYLIIYISSSLATWSGLVSIQIKKNRYTKKQNKDFADLTLIKKNNLMLTILLHISLFSTAGLPPFIGFITKMEVFLVSVESHIFLISLITILLSVVSSFYYLRLIKITCFEKVLVGKLHKAIKLNQSIVNNVLGFFLIYQFLKPGLVTFFSYRVIIC